MKSPQTEIEQVSFKRDQNPPRILCDKELEAVDAAGQSHKFRPQAHVSKSYYSASSNIHVPNVKHPDYISRLKKFFNRVEMGYKNGKPRHISDPECSGFAILSSDVFQKMSAWEVQNLFRHKSVVVTGCPHPDLQFNETGLRTLAPLDSQVSLQG
jgi:hypothetical protein